MKLSNLPRRLWILGVLIAAAPVLVGIASMMASSSKERDLGAGILLTGAVLLGLGIATVIWVVGAIAGAVQVAKGPSERFWPGMWGAGNAVCAIAAASFIYRMVYLP